MPFFGKAFGYWLLAVGQGRASWLLVIGYLVIGRWQASNLDRAPRAKANSDFGHHFLFTLQVYLAEQRSGYYICL
jgi:hypothetical protein